VLLTSPASETDAFGPLSLLSSYLAPPRHLRAGNVFTRKDPIMAIGTVKFFNTDRGYGFISNEDGGPDAFVHITAVEARRHATLKEGQRLSYELESGRERQELRGQPRRLDLPSQGAPTWPRKN
jgi:CspA family cold shock protein